MFIHGRFKCECGELDYTVLAEMFDGMDAYNELRVAIQTMTRVVAGETAKGMR